MTFVVSWCHACYYCTHRSPTQAACLFVCSSIWNIKKCMGMLLSLNIVNLYQVMCMIKLKIDVKFSQLFCIVVSAASKWQNRAIWWVLRWLLLLQIAQIRHFKQQKYFHACLYISNIQYKQTCRLYRPPVLYPNSQLANQKPCMLSCYPVIPRKYKSE